MHDGNSKEYTPCYTIRLVWDVIQIQLDAAQTLSRSSKSKSQLCELRREEREDEKGAAYRISTAYGEFHLETQHIRCNPRPCRNPDHRSRASVSICIASPLPDGGYSQQAEKMPLLRPGRLHRFMLRHGSRLALSRVPDSPDLNRHGSVVAAAG
ncbi:hypothetical protein N657DRAFT_190125 [Parathielavia appendiculata]|uniref:Uncharacterized protein n=1 Tax=Parathielavia appendiculata TaxID=2587402 RepID=A0AAN6Z6K8_9PEZI|nr:hypothetical protein N657DRAFT_190125 [Parathielavia appendiculata]